MLSNLGKQRDFVILVLLLFREVGIVKISLPKVKEDTCEYAKRYYIHID